MIETVALTILMPVMNVIPTAPRHLPGPVMPITIPEGVRLPGPILPAAIQLPAPVLPQAVVLPGPIGRPLAVIRVGEVRVAPKPVPTTIDALRKLVKDDRPLAVRKTFDGVTLPERDLEDELGVPPVAAR